MRTAGQGECAEPVACDYGEVHVVGSLDDAYALADSYASEHVQILTENPRDHASILEKRTVADRYCCEADPAAGEPGLLSQRERGIIAMTVNVTPHLNFRGNARQALEFYQSVFGGELTVASYADMGDTDPATADHVTFGQVTGDNGFRIMAYDVYPQLDWDRGQDPFFVSVRGADAAELQAYWDKLADGAQVRQPLGPSPWAPLYGQLTDRYGITWVLDIAVDHPTA